MANFSTKENVRPNSSQNQLKNQARLRQDDNLNADLEFQDEFPGSRGIVRESKTPVTGVGSVSY